MTAGYNSDIVLDGVVYHIQTEDKGPKTAEIVTQIFREGAVVFTRRTPYPSQPDQSNYTTLLEGLVRSQHRKLLQHVRAGGLRRKTLLQKALSGDHLEASAPSLEDALKVADPIAAPTESPDRKPQAAAQAARSDTITDRSLHAVPQQQPPVDEMPAPSSEPQTTELEDGIIEDPLRALEGQPPPLATAETQPARAYKSEERADIRIVASPDSPAPAAVDAGIPETAQAGALSLPYGQGEQCEIQLLSGKRLSPGEVQPLSLQLRTDRQQLPIPNARITVRVYGQTIRPLSYCGRSDAEGRFSVDVLIPYYTVGTSHVEITARTPVGSGILRLDVSSPAAAK